MMKGNSMVTRKRIRLAFLPLAVLVGFILLSALTGPVHGADVKYMPQVWQSRGPEINVIKESGARQARVIDNAGRSLFVTKDYSPLRNRHRIVDSCRGEIFVMQQQHGYHWRLVRLNRSGEELATLPAKTPPRIQDSITIIPEHNVVVFDGSNSMDLCFGMRTGIFEMRRLDNGERIPLETGLKCQDRPRNHVFETLMDRSGNGIWMADYAKKGSDYRLVRVDFTGETTHDRKLGDSSRIMDCGVMFEGDPYFLLATKDPSIGGVKAKRELLALDPQSGRTRSGSLSFDTWTTYNIRARAMQDVLIFHDDGKICAVDPETLKIAWQNRPKLPGDQYQLYQSAVSPSGETLAVVANSHYRKPGEKAAILLYSNTGELQERVELRRGSISAVKYTDKGDLLVFADTFTACIGDGAGETRRRALSLEAPQKKEERSGEKASSAQVADYPAIPSAKRHRLWYRQPGEGWPREYLPLGNGSLGGMLSGGTEREHIQFNVDSLWRGDENNMKMYQAFGDVYIDLGHKEVSDYRRELDLRRGLYRVEYTHDGATYTREAFCSHPAGVMIMRLTADKPGAYSGTISLRDMHSGDMEATSDGLAFRGQLGNGLKYACRLAVRHRGGKLTPVSGTKKIKNKKAVSVRADNCDRITLILAADTDYSFDASAGYRGKDPQKRIGPRIAKVLDQSFETLRREHVADVTALFDRCILTLECDPAAADLPTDKRLEQYRTKRRDNGIGELAFDMARYLMIACSRPGSLPANLQGLWNKSNNPPWACDYHTDINVQMNYWFTEPANLPECHIPLFDYIESQIPMWRRTTRKKFDGDVRGWSLHYMNGIFGAGGWKWYHPASAWLAQHYFEHYAFGRDKSFLKKRAYPVLKEVCHYWEDQLLTRPDGTLVTPKGISPEHGPWQYGVTQDVAIVRDLFGNYIDASERLDTDPAYRDRIDRMRANLLDYQIGRWGQLQEWEEDRDSRWGHHRHMMHLFGLHPGHQIHPLTTPQLARAAKTSLQARGDGGSGWSLAWKISFWARLLNGERAGDIAAKLLSTKFCDNLFDMHPPFQIDGNFGYGAAVCEMLLQSHLQRSDGRRVLHLLPALPRKRWPTGNITGLRARGGYEVDITWHNGAMVEARIHGKTNTKERCTIRYGDRTATFPLRRGETIAVSGALERIAP